MPDMSDTPQWHTIIASTPNDNHSGQAKIGCKSGAV